MLPLILMKISFVVSFITFALVLVRWLSKNELWSGRAHKAITFFCFPALLILFTAMSFYADDRRISLAVLAGFIILWALDSYIWNLAKKKLYEKAKNLRQAKKIIWDAKPPKNG